MQAGETLESDFMAVGLCHMKRDIFKTFFTMLQQNGLAVMMEDYCQKKEFATYIFIFQFADISVRS